MYRVIIVEDEEIIREGLKSGIPWNELGFEVSGVFTNGKCAADFLKYEKADVLITDIRMPVMNGIELVAYIHKNQFATKVIVLSGFADFTYAQQAVRFGVYEYILKPIRLKDFIVSIQRLKKLLDDESQKMDEILKWKRIAMEGGAERQASGQPPEHGGEDHSVQEYLYSDDISDGNIIVKKAKDYVSANYMRKISLQIMSEHLFVNASYFSSLFSRVCGKTFTEYLTSVRIEKAKRLLGQGEIPLYEIAESVGYTDYRVFCKAFKRETGISTHEYKKMEKHRH